MSAKDLLAAIIAGDKEAVKDTFDQIMAEKTSEKIDDMRMDVAQTMFGEGKTPYEIGKDEKEAEDAEDEADEAEKKLDKDKGDSGDDSDESGDDSDDSGDDSDESGEDADDSDEKDAKFKKKVSEEVEGLNELSSKTLKNYMYKASADSQRHATKARNLRVLADPEDPAEQDTLNTMADKHAAKAKSRRAGLGLAAKKVSEEVDSFLDETFGNYSEEELEEFMESDAYGQLDEISMGLVQRYHQGRFDQYEKNVDSIKGDRRTKAYQAKADELQDKLYKQVEPSGKRFRSFGNRSGAKDKKKGVMKHYFERGVEYRKTIKDAEAAHKENLKAIEKKYNG